MCNKTVLENYGRLKFVPDNYKNQKMCNQALQSCGYVDALEYVPKYSKKCVIKLLIFALLYFILFLIDIKLE